MINNKSVMDYTISGGLGFIGKNLVNEILSRDKGVKLRNLDKHLGSDISLENIVFPDCKTFIHLAAHTNVRSSLRYPEGHINQNISITLKCLESTRLSPAKFIFVSSMGAPHSLSPYSASKYACESICKAYKNSYGMDIKILRISNVYGKHSVHKTSVIAKFIKQCLFKKDIEIIGDGLQTRDFVHVDDVVNTIINPSDLDIINVASGQPMTILSLANKIKNISQELLSYSPKITYLPIVSGEINNVDTLTDIKTIVNFEEGLRETFKWFIERYNA